MNLSNHVLIQVQKTYRFVDLYRARMNRVNQNKTFFLLGGRVTAEFILPIGYVSLSSR